MGIFTIGQLAAANPAVLALHFGADNAASLLRRAAGIDDSPVEPPGDPKSISRETTLAEDTGSLTEMTTILHGLADEVAWALREEGLSARCVYIKLRLLPTRRKWQPGGIRVRQADDEASYAAHADRSCKSWYTLPL